MYLRLIKNPSAWLPVLIGLPTLSCICFLSGCGLLPDKWTDSDKDGHKANIDCNDDDDDIYPGASEIWYDGIDSDCDGSNDYDYDQDGYNAADYGGDDCDDTSAKTHPGAAALEAPEACMLDADGDGYGSMDVSEGIDVGSDCDDSNPDLSPADSDRDGYSSCTGDCNDDNEKAYPGAAWNESSADCMTDHDGDGWGSESTATGAIAGEDCDDSDEETHPGAAWDESYYECMTDRDHDGWGNENPNAGVTAGTDCDDEDNQRNPGELEWCDGIDNDCDNKTDDDDFAYDATEYCEDNDGDGYGSPNTSVLRCDAPFGYVPNCEDCNDNKSTVNPSRTEICGDGVDQDCSGTDLSCQTDLIDDFDTGFVSGVHWQDYDGTITSSQYSSYPYSFQMDGGGQYLWSEPWDTSSCTSVSWRYHGKRGPETPDVGDYLYLATIDSTGATHILDSWQGNDYTDSSFTTRSGTEYSLTGEITFFFQAIGSGAGFDHFYVDDVSIVCN